MCDKNPPTIPVALGAIMGVFEQYASSDNNKNTLSKDELYKLIDKEMGPMFKGDKGKPDVEAALKIMDFDKDGVVTFREFMTVLACIACQCHGKEYETQTKKK